jgi:hypothetical protein
MTLDDEVRGIKDMMVAMINLAAKELANNLEGSINYDHAKVWFDSADEKYIFSFRSCCETLELDPNYIKEGIYARLKKNMDGEE